MKKPKYFVVKTDESSPLQKVYKQWLNETYNQGWNIDSSFYYYYGYDGNYKHNGTDAHDRVSLFVNDPVILTLDEWYVLFIDNKCDFVIECKSNEEFDYVAVKYNHHGVTYFNFKAPIYFNKAMDYGSEKEKLYPNHKVVSFNIYKKFIANDNQTTEMKKQTLTLEQLKQLYKSNDCSDWQSHIKDHYLIPNSIENDTIEIKVKQESIDLLLEKGSSAQKKLLTDLGIVLEVKNNPKSWEELKNIKGVFLSLNANISPFNNYHTEDKTNRNIIPTKELAEEILQFIQLSQCYYRYIGDWRPDWTKPIYKHLIRVFRDELAVESYQNTRHFFAFPTTEMRDEFYTNFKEQLEKCKSLV